MKALGSSALIFIFFDIFLEVFYVFLLSLFLALLDFLEDFFSGLEVVLLDVLWESLTLELLLASAGSHRQMVATMIATRRLVHLCVAGNAILRFI